MKPNIQRFLINVSALLGVTHDCELGLITRHEFSHIAWSIPFLPSHENEIPPVGTIERLFYLVDVSPVVGVAFNNFALTI